MAQESMQIDRGKVDEFIARHGTGREGTIPILQGIQETYRYVPIEALEYVCARTDITRSQLHGVVTFYTQFRLKPVGQHLIRVCKGTACHVSGAEGLTDALAEQLGVPPEGTTEDRRFTLSEVACLGCCSLAPVIMVNDDTYGKLNRSKVTQVMTEEYGAPRAKNE